MNRDLDKWIQRRSARLEENDRSKTVWQPYGRNDVLYLAFKSFRRGYNLGTRQTKYRGGHPFNYKISSDRENGGDENG